MSNANRMNRQVKEQRDKGRTELETARARIAELEEWASTALAALELGKALREKAKAERNTAQARAAELWEREREREAENERLREQHESLVADSNVSAAAQELAERERDALEAALEDCYAWIKNWSPSFTDEDEWDETETKIKAALKAEGGA